jgi:hypothetical protein
MVDTLLGELFEELDVDSARRDLPWGSLMAFFGGRPLPLYTTTPFSFMIVVL